MSENRVTTADLSSGCRQATASPNLVQWDRGQILKLTGVTLPLAYNVEFTTPSSAESTTMIGNADGVEIPDALLETGEPIVAYVVLHDTQNDRESEYWVTIVVRTRQRPEDIDPDADQMALIDQLVAALDEGVDQAEAAAAQAEAAVEKYPRVINGNWYVWDEATEEWIDTEVPATGPTGVGIASITQNADYTLTITFTDGNDWTTPTPVRGAQGETGATPNLSIGTVSTLAAGSPATASISGTPENPVLSLGIPKGADGDVSSASMAATFSSSTAYTKGTMVWYSGQLYEFTADHAAGAWTGSDARAVKVGEEVSTLKSALTVVVEEKASKNLYDSSKIESGYINQTNGNVESQSTNKHSDYIPVENTFVISVESLLNTGFRYAIYNSAKQYITGTSLPTFSEAPSGRYYLVVTNANAAYLRFSDRNSIMLRQWQVENGSTPTSYEAYFTPYYTLNDELIIPTNQVNGLPDVVSRLSSAESDIDDLQDAVSDVSETVTFDKYITDIYTTPYNSGYMATNGAVSSSTTFDYTDKISVQPGDVLYGETTDRTELCLFRFVCAFSGDTAVSDKGNSSDLATYTVPSGIDGVVVSQRKAASGKTRSVRIERVREQETTNLKKTPMGYMRVSGTLSSGEELHVAENNVKNNVCVAFSGNVTAFSKLYIGQRKGTSWKRSYIEIDSTNVVIHTDQGDATAAHGLTIGSDIQVLIETQHAAETSLVRICSDGNVYNDTTPHRWLCDEGYSAVVSDGSTLTDCVLTWTSRNINEPVWIFGDSYVSLYSVRWVYWMLQDGFDMPMINGYAGEPSQNAVISLKNLLDCRQPQYILWELGMNDGDSENAVNASWKRNFDIFIGLCKQHGITPILATIPNVPTVNNRFKNAIIRASGYRYIEFSKAVDPDEDGTWIGNTLSLDGVHPTVDGARVLYMRALADFPELTSL